jgi:cation-transporting ATPase 13A2
LHVIRFDQNLTFAQIEQETTQTFIDLDTRNLRRILYGENTTDMPVKSVLYLLFDEVLHPFYIFQLASVIIWLCDSYYLYAVTIVVSSVVSIFTNLFETRQNMKTLQQMSTNSQTNIHVHSNHSRRLTSSTKLLPGDIIEVEEDTILTCDAILISGQCLVDEAMLTGESVPVIKTALPLNSNPDKYYNREHDKSSTLFSGTHVLQVTDLKDKKALAICTRTAFDTSKGKILLSIVYPKESLFHFYRDSFIFIGIMAIFGKCYTV